MLEISIILQCSTETTPRANVVVSTSIPHPIPNSLETYLTKVSSIIFFTLGFRFLISDSCF